MSQPSPFTTWNSNIALEVIAKELQTASAQNIEVITPGSALASGVTDFSLLLSAAANVQLTTVGGQTVTVALPAGYNPIRVASVASVSAGTAYALY